MWLTRFSIAILAFASLAPVFGQSVHWERSTTEHILFSGRQSSEGAAHISRSVGKIQFFPRREASDSRGLEWTLEDDTEHWLTEIRAAAVRSVGLQPLNETGNGPEAPFPWLASGFGAFFSAGGGRTISGAAVVPGAKRYRLALSYDTFPFVSHGAVLVESVLTRIYYSVRQGYAGSWSVVQSLQYRPSFRSLFLPSNPDSRSSGIRSDRSLTGSRLRIVISLWHAQRSSVQVSFLFSQRSFGDSSARGYLWSHRSYESRQNHGGAAKGKFEPEFLGSGLTWSPIPQPQFYETNGNGHV